MSFVTAASESEHQFGEITILIEYDKNSHMIGIAMNGIRKAPRWDLLTAIGFLDVALRTGELTPMAQKILTDAKIPLQSALATYQAAGIHLPNPQ